MLRSVCLSVPDGGRRVAATALQTCQPAAQEALCRHTWLALRCRETCGWPGRSSGGSHDSGSCRGVGRWRRQSVTITWLGPMGACIARMGQQNGVLNVRSWKAEAHVTKTASPTALLSCMPGGQQALVSIACTHLLLHQPLVARVPSLAKQRPIWPALAQRHRNPRAVEHP